MAHVERARGSWYGNIDHHVALGKQFITQAVALAADDESHIFGKLRVVDAGGVVGGFDGYNLFTFGNDFVQVAFLAEIPTDIVAAGGGGTTHLT